MRTVALLVLVLFVAHAHCALIYASPDGAGANCTMVDPCSLPQACSAAVSGDTVQLLDGNYQVENSPCVINNPNVSVVGSANVATVCNNSCFVVNAIPFSLTSLYVSSYGSSVPPPQALIYGDGVLCDTSLSPVAQVQVTDVHALTTFNNFFYLNTTLSTTNETSIVEIAFNDVDITGSTPMDSTVGPITARASGRQLSWSFSTLSFNDFTTTNEVPLLDVSAAQAPTTVVVDVFAVTDCIVYSVIDASLGGTFTLQNAVIDDVSNYEAESGRTSALVSIDGFNEINILGLSFSNIVNDSSGLMFVRGHVADLSTVIMSNCTAANNGDQVYALWTSCSTDPCTHTITDWEVSSATYDLAGYFLYDYYSNTTLTVQSSTFTDVTCYTSEVLSVARCGVILSDLTFAGGEYEWGSIGVSSPKSIDASGLYYNNVTSTYPLITLSEEVTRSANITFDQVEVEDSVVDGAIFYIVPGDSDWDIVISNSDFSTDSSNTTAIVSCNGSDTATGGADVLVETSTCDIGDQCAAIDEGYISDDVCNFEVDDAAICNACSSSSDNGDDDDDNGSTDWGKIISWTLVALAILAGIVVVVAVVVIIVIIVVRKQKQKQGYEAI
mmetsp:Transcript_14597/g.57310  ORF Transcript_14597/g.57310 Transcript_14597/m.57310 type:complete len:612 (-) Transcript_14597:31-1866(-)